MDEVNLLDDHLVDVLLDSAASGWNTVEREGISISHPARFILVGSGNPEEGELRPQLLDRFGMHAQIGTVKDPRLRVQIVSERSLFDESPAPFRAKFDGPQNALTAKIVEAQGRLRAVDMPYEYRRVAAAALFFARGAAAGGWGRAGRSALLAAPLPELGPAPGS